MSQDTEQRHRVATAHGEVEYETVECTSCGEDVAREAADRIVVGEVTEKRDYTLIGHTTYEFAGSPAEGWVCEYCRDDPAGFPTPQINLSTEDVLFIAGMLIVISSFLFPLGWEIVTSAFGPEVVEVPL